MIFLTRVWPTTRFFFPFILYLCIILNKEDRKLLPNYSKYVISLISQNCNQYIISRSNWSWTWTWNLLAILCSRFHPFCGFGIFLSIILSSLDPKVSIMRYQWYQNYGNTGFWWCLLLGLMMLKWCLKTYQNQTYRETKDAKTKTALVSNNAYF